MLRLKPIPPVAPDRGADVHDRPTSLLPSRIIDAHVHLWDLGRLAMPWIGPPLNRNFLLQDYRAASADLRITGALYVEVGVAAHQRYDEADYAVELARRPDNPLSGVVMSGDVSYGHFLRYIEGHPPRRWIKGVRQRLPDELWETSAFVRGVRKLGELGLVFELNTELARALDLVERCPDTRFVLDHFGGLSHEILASEGRTAGWARDIAALADHPNVACKISGVISTGPAGWDARTGLAAPMKHLLTVFGARRLMFGGDWPICTLANGLQAWTELVAGLLQQTGEDEQAAIFHDTAMRWYALEEPDA